MTSNIQKLPDSNAGQVNPGQKELNLYFAYLRMHTTGPNPLTIDEWRKQHNMLKSQLLKEG